MPVITSTRGTRFMAQLLGLHTWLGAGQVVQGACSRKQLGACPFLFAPQRRAKALMAQKFFFCDGLAASLWISLGGGPAETRPGSSERSHVEVRQFLAITACPAYHPVADLR